MKKNNNFIIGFLISAFLHIAIISIFLLRSSQDTNISISKEQVKAFGISFAQIAQTDYNQEALANQSTPKEESKQEVVKEDKIEKEVVKEIKEEIIKKPSKDIEKIKPKKIVNKKVLDKPKKNLKNKLESKKENKQPSKQTPKIQDIKADNAQNVLGGSTSSGDVAPQNTSGSNLNGEIYQALKKHMSYPKIAIEQELQGRVIVEFKQIDKDRFEYIRVTKSSGYKSLDDHAIKIVNNAKHSLPVKSYGLNIKIPIIFDLNEV